MLCLKAHVVSVCFKYFSCFRGMLQVFHMDVAKIDQDVTYVAMIIHVCFCFIINMLQVCLSG
jgi:hypothetical protein